MGQELLQQVWADSQLRALNCCSCGAEFAMSESFYDQRLRDRVDFYCPAGHPQHFIGKTTEQKRIEELERALEQQKSLAESAQRQRAWAETNAKGAAIAAGKARAKAARLQHRIECGTCPNCHRTFKQLAAHMLAKHGVTGNAGCGVGREEQQRKRAR